MHHDQKARDAAHGVGEVRRATAPPLWAALGRLARSVVALVRALARDLARDPLAERARADRDYREYLAVICAAEAAGVLHVPPRAPDARPN